MTDECIHGFPTELCDICAPRQRETPAEPTAPAPRRTRITTDLRSTPAPSRVPGGPLRSAVPDLPEPRVFASLRAHHATHIDNLPGIVSDGAIVAAAEANPAVDVSSTATRTARSEASAPDGSPVAGHVAFALSPDATRWDELRRGAEGERWSDAARRTRATDYVVLVVPVSAFGASVIVPTRTPRPRTSGSRSVPRPRRTSSAAPTSPTRRCTASSCSPGRACRSRPSP